MSELLGVYLLCREPSSLVSGVFNVEPGMGMKNRAGEVYKKQGQFSEKSHFFFQKEAISS